MVGIVVVAHSADVAKSAADFALYMAPKAKVLYAGGKDDGSMGISNKKIARTIKKASSKDGVIVIVDMGGAAFVSKEIILSLKKEKYPIAMVDCPLLEGVVVAALEAQMGKNIDEIKREVESTKGIAKW